MYYLSIRNIYRFECGIKKCLLLYLNIIFIFREKFENVQKELEIVLEENEVLKFEREEQV